MALTGSAYVGLLPGAGQFVSGTLTFDNSYATGGLAVTPAILGAPTTFSTVTWMLVTAVRGAAATVGNSVRFNPATQKLLIFNSTAGAETANAVDTSAVVCDYIALVR